MQTTSFNLVLRVMGNCFFATLEAQEVLKVQGQDSPSLVCIHVVTRPTV